MASQIYQGDVIDTGPDGAVNLIFADESTIAFSENARLAIDEYVYDPDEMNGASKYSFLRGIFVYVSGLIGQAHKDDVEIETPMGSIGIRGTELMIEVQESDGVGTTTVTVISGVVDVTNKVTEEEVTLEADETTTVTGPLPRFSPFSIDNLGGVSLSSAGSAEAVSVGYARVRASEGSTPSGVAIFGFTQNGILVSEAGVPAVAPMQEGRIFAEVNGPVNTGLAMANPNDEAATIGFFFTDVDGTNFGSGNFILGANQQTAKFLDQEPFNGGSSVLGTFTFTSSVPIAVVALRGLTNERSEFLITTLPVAPLSASTSGTIYLPHFADGAGWTTQVILVNPTDATMTGTMQFLGQGSGTTAASPVNLMFDDGSAGSNFAYQIAPRSSRRFTTTNPATVSVGSVRVTADTGSGTPSGLGAFSYAVGGVTVSEAGVPALPQGAAFRIYAETSGVPGQVGSVRSGVAITDTSGTSNTVTLELTNLDGSLAMAPATLSIPPSGQVARFLDELFSLPAGFSGVLRLTSTSEVAVVALRACVNERADFMITTTPPTNEADPVVSVDTYFPHIVDSQGWATQFILFSGIAGPTSAGSLSFFRQDGEVFELPLN